MAPLGRSAEDVVGRVEARFLRTSLQGYSDSVVCSAVETARLETPGA